MNDEYGIIDVAVRRKKKKESKTPLSLRDISPFRRESLYIGLSKYFSSLKGYSLLGKMSASADKRVPVSGEKDVSFADRRVTKAAVCGEAARLTLTQEAENTNP